MLTDSFGSQATGVSMGTVRHSYMKETISAYFRVVFVDTFLQWTLKFSSHDKLLVMW